MCKNFKEKTGWGFWSLTKNILFKSSHMAVSYLVSHFIILILNLFEQICTQNNCVAIVRCRFSLTSKTTLKIVPRLGKAAGRTGSFSPCC